MLYQTAKWITFICVSLSFLLNGLTTAAFFSQGNLSFGFSFLAGVLLLAFCGVLLLTKRFGWALIVSIAAAILLCYLGFYLEMHSNLFYFGTDMHTTVVRNQYSSVVIPFLCALTFGFYKSYENKQEQIVFLKTIKDQEPKSTIFKDEG